MINIGFEVSARPDFNLVQCAIQNELETESRLTSLQADCLRVCRGLIRDSCFCVASANRAFVLSVMKSDMNRQDRPQYRAIISGFYAGFSSSN